MKRILQLLQWVLAPAIILLACSALWHLIHHLSVQQLRAAWAATSLRTIVWSLLATAVSFACLAGYELFATRRMVPGRVPADVALRVGAMSHAISNTLGFHALTGAALRYHLYRRLGLDVADVARVVAIVAVCVGAGVVMISALALMQVRAGAGNVFPVVLVIATVLLLGMALFIRARRGAAWGITPGALKAWASVLPMATIEMAAAIGALYVLLPMQATPPFAQFALIFVGAMLLGIISHSPGGIGVFEATMLVALPVGQGPRVLVALLLYRVLYNLVPFIVAMATLLLEKPRQRASMQSVGRRI